MELKKDLKQIATIVIGTCMLLSFSCETDHSTEKYILNLSEHTVLVQYSEYTFDYVITHTELLPQDSLLVTQTWSRGSQEEPNAARCTITESDSILIESVTDSTLLFTGDLANENRWNSDFTPGRSSRQVCKFAIVNNDFAE